ncbi:hypothetical protein CEB3_c18370 [Peptococcaceae bacterium CEB3]|nr:hypothetical protein CEB3_c18370 [Peptococcaceae bacterium CEB3]
MITGQPKVLCLKVMNSVMTVVDSSAVSIPAATTRPVRPEAEEDEEDSIDLRGQRFLLRSQGTGISR